MPSSRPETRQGPDRRALWRAFWRPGLSQLVVGLMIMAVVAASIVTVRSRAKGADPSTMRRDDLIALIDSLDADSARLDTRVAELERTLAELQGGADSERVAAQEAARRAAALSVLAGTAPARGPGVRIVVDDPQQKVTSQHLVDAVAELRDAGAEVIELNDRHRVVLATWFGAPGARVGVDGQPLDLPLTIEAIGDPHSLEEGARFRGGLVSRLQSSEVGASVSITPLDRIDVDTVVTLAQPRHARPS